METNAVVRRPLGRSRFWHPFGMRVCVTPYPEVSTMLRPPATIWHPSGMSFQVARNQWVLPQSSPPGLNPDPRIASRCLPIPKGCQIVAGG